MKDWEWGSRFCANWLPLCLQKFSPYWWRTNPSAPNSKNQTTEPPQRPKRQEVQMLTGLIPLPPSQFFDDELLRTKEHAASHPRVRGGSQAAIRKHDTKGLCILVSGKLALIRGWPVSDWWEKSCTSGVLEILQCGNLETVHSALTPIQMTGGMVIARI